MGGEVRQELQGGLVNAGEPAQLREIVNSGGGGARPVHQQGLERFLHRLLTVEHRGFVVPVLVIPLPDAEVPARLGPPESDFEAEGHNAANGGRRP